MGNETIVSIPKMKSNKSWLMSENIGKTAPRLGWINNPKPCSDFARHDINLPFLGLGFCYLIFLYALVIIGGTIKAERSTPGRFDKTMAAGNTLYYSHKITYRKVPTEQEIKNKIALAFGKDADRAIKVAFCESSLDPFAKNTETPDYGLFQISTLYHPYRADELLDLDKNIEVARGLYEDQGNWGAWSASEKCWREL